MATTTQRQLIDTAFRSSQAAVAVASPGLSKSRPTHTIPHTAALPRKRIQAAWLGLSLLVSCLILACGTLYLYGCANLAKETLRSAYLRTEKKKEQALAEEWQNRRNQIHNSNYIEQKARDYQMVPANDKETIRIAPTE